MNHKTAETIASLTNNQSPSVLPGWCTTDKALRLAELVIEHTPVLLVELGVFGARSFIPMALALQEVQERAPQISHLAIGIDPWSADAAIEGMDPHDANDQKHIDYWSKVPLHDVHRRAIAAIDILKLWPVVGMLQARAERAVNLFPDGTIDFCHIDGNHHHAVRDVTLWIPKCRQGAIIAFDDSNWPETQAGLELMDQSCELMEDLGTWRIYRKK